MPPGRRHPARWGAYIGEGEEPDLRAERAAEIPVHPVQTGRVGPGEGADHLPRSIENRDDGRRLCRRAEVVVDPAPYSGSVPVVGSS